MKFFYTGLNKFMWNHPFIKSCTHFTSRFCPYMVAKMCIRDRMCSFYKQRIKNGLNLQEDYRVFNDVKENEYNEEEYLSLIHIFIMN